MVDRIVAEAQHFPWPFGSMESRIEFYANVVSTCRNALMKEERTKQNKYPHCQEPIADTYRWICPKGPVEQIQKK